MAGGKYLRGEVYWLESGVLVYPNGRLMDKRRPVVIVSANKGNERADAVNVLFMTTQEGAGGHDKVFTWISKPRKSWVMCTQMFTVDKSYLRDYVGQLSTNELQRVNENLREFLALGSSDGEIIASRDEIIRLREEELEAQEKKISVYGEEIERLRAEVESLKADLRSLSDNSRYEIDLWQRMYSKAVDSVVTMQMGRDVSRRTELRQEIVGAEEPVKVEEPGPVKVNINTASAKEISIVTGMSVSVAYCITGYRKKNGEYEKIEDTLKVQRFSERMFAKYRDKMEV